MIKRIKIIQYRNITVAQFDTNVASNGCDEGRRVKHLVYPDDELEGCYWHEVSYLTCDPKVKPTQTYNLFVSKRKFWNKARLVHHRICCKEDTWKTIALSIDKLKESKKPIK